MAKLKWLLGLIEMIQISFTLADGIYTVGYTVNKGDSVLYRYGADLEELITVLIKDVENMKKVDR